MPGTCISSSRLACSTPLTLPNARLVSVEGGGHAPWIEAPALVLAAIDTFLRGEWLDQSDNVVSLLVDGQ